MKLSSENHFKLMKLLSENDCKLIKWFLWIPGQLHGDLAGFAEAFLDADVHLAEHDLLAVRVFRFVAEEVADGQRCHHGTRFVDDVGHALDGPPDARTPTSRPRTLLLIAHLPTDLFRPTLLTFSNFFFFFFFRIYSPIHWIHWKSFRIDYIINKLLLLFKLMMNLSFNWIYFERIDHLYQSFIANHSELIKLITIYYYNLSWWLTWILIEFISKELIIYMNNSLKIILNWLNYQYIFIII